MSHSKTESFLDNKTMLKINNFEVYLHIFRCNSSSLSLNIKPLFYRKEPIQNGSLLAVTSGCLTSKMGIQYHLHSISFQRRSISAAGLNDALIIEIVGLLSYVCLRAVTLTAKSYT